MGPVAISAILLLLIAAPLMRGGNRQVALIALETISVLALLGIFLRRALAKSPASRSGFSPRQVLVWVLTLSPAWLAAVYLAPLPASIWSSLAGRSIYAPLMNDAGIAQPAWLALTLAPDATAASLLAGLPLVAAFAAGMLGRLSQIRVLLWVVVVMAFAQIALGLMQIAGGPQSQLYFGDNGNRPVGTFANANHFANYLAMALAGYVWLGWNSLLHRFAGKNALTLWIMGGLLMVMGILLSRSRGAAFTGLPLACIAMGVALTAGRESQSWRLTLVLIGSVLAGAVALVGLGSLASRFEMGGLASSASFRNLLAATTLTGSQEFWPWGSGWGSYALVYPRFQPLSVGGYADHAHHDYAQMLFEGGVFAVVLAAIFVWLAGSRAFALVRKAMRHGSLSREEMAATLCGLGLLGMLLHSLVEFNMHIPANAILGCLLAGIYLRPLGKKDERP